MALVEVRNRVRDLTNRLQGVLSHVEENDKPKAVLAIAECLSELSKITTLIANGFLEDSADEVKELKMKSLPSVKGE